MAALSSGIFLFSVGFMTHLFFWKVHVPEKQIRALLSIFFSVFLVGISVFVGFSENNRIVAAIAPDKFYEYISLSTLFFSLLGVYLFLYLGLVDEGPSVTFVLSIADAGEKGIDKKTLQRLITPEKFFKSRMESLVENKFIYKAGEKYVVLSKGFKLLALVNKLRRLMNISIKIG